MFIYVIYYTIYNVHIIDISVVDGALYGRLGVRVVAFVSIYISRSLRSLVRDLIIATLAKI